MCKDVIKRYYFTIPYDDTGRMQLKASMPSAVFSVCLRVNSEMTWQRFLSNLRSGSALEASLTSGRRQRAPLKWLMVQPIRVVLLIANGGPFCRLLFLR